ncbi:MAG: PAS domain-containing protein, partial [Pseudomonadota bacterium]
MADQIEIETKDLDAPSPSRFDWLQAAFWACLMLAVAAASVAIAWPSAVGGTGPVLLISMAAGGMVFLLWIIRGAGRRMGLFPDRGAMADAMQPAVPRHSWIHALDEAVLVSDPGGAPLVANEAYLTLANEALIAQSDMSAPVSVDRIFSSAPGLAAPIFRLSKAAKNGERLREVLPAMVIGAEGLPTQFEASVSPLKSGRVVWRLRRLSGGESVTGAADMRALYVEDAPMGFFSAKADGTVTYMNGWLRDLLDLPENVRNVRLDDIMRPEFVKMLRRDRKSGLPGRADIMIRSRDGVEVPVQALTTWSGKGADASGRTVIISKTQAAMDGDSRMLAVSA